MRSSFPEFYPPTEEQFATMWDTGTFAFDTNILLNVYRVTRETSDAFLDIVKKLSPRIWLPHQVCLEFHRNRLDVVLTSIGKFDDIENVLDAKIKAIEEESGERVHPVRKVVPALKKAKNLLANASREYKELHGLTMGTTDPWLDKLETLFEGKVGKQYTEQELSDLHKIGDQRYKNQIPPGFEDAKEDAKRPENERHGDFIVWKQLIDHGQSNKLPIIFVTNDAKNDWWHKPKGKTTGPHPSLRREMHQNGVDLFWMYSTQRFMEWAQKRFDLKIESAVDEMRSLAEKERQNAIAHWIPDKRDTSDALLAAYYSSVERVHEALQRMPPPRLLSEEDLQQLRANAQRKVLDSLIGGKILKQSPENSEPKDESSG